MTRRAKRPTPPARSRGRQLLLRALADGLTQAVIAERCGVTREAISRLARGVPSDSYRLRTALERALGIPTDAWDQEASVEWSDLTTALE